MLKMFYAHHQSECALVCYYSVEEAVQAKTLLDKNPTIGGIPVTFQLASTSTIEELCEQIQLRTDANQQQLQQQHKDNKQPWGFSSATNQGLPKSSTVPNISYSSASQWETPVNPTKSYPSSVANNISNGNDNHFGSKIGDVDSPRSSFWAGHGCDPGVPLWLDDPGAPRKTAGKIDNASSVDSMDLFPMNASEDAGKASSSSTSTINVSTSQPFLPVGMF